MFWAILKNECINLVRKVQSPGVEFLCQDASMYNQAIESSEKYYRRETSMCLQQETTYVEPEQKPGKMNPNHFNGPSKLWSSTGMMLPTAAPRHQGTEWEDLFGIKWQNQRTWKVYVMNPMKLHTVHCSLSAFPVSSASKDLICDLQFWTWTSPMMISCFRCVASLDDALFTLWPPAKNSYKTDSLRNSAMVQHFWEKLKYHLEGQESCAKTDLMTIL